MHRNIQETPEKSINNSRKLKEYMKVANEILKRIIKNY